ncbi:MAG TPA: diacylglycerol kinase family protein [Candidatus Dormibacteraeota bacterium]|nr:diacylglycerol kinase family protein [Candidatus Dormibacteraeota bacterium]
MRRFALSFTHAFDGIVAAARVQPNLVVHLIVAATAFVVALALHVSLWAFVVVVLLVALVLGLELMNTAIEAQVDLATLELHPVAKRAKDAAAGAVLVASVGAVLAGLAIFISAWVSGYRAPAVPALDAQTVVAALGLSALFAVLLKARYGAAFSGRATVPWTIAALVAFTAPASLGYWPASAAILFALAVSVTRRPLAVAILSGPLLGAGAACLCLLAHDPRML